MSAIILLISVSLVVAVVFLFAFIWSVRSGQYEDKYTPSVRMLFEEDEMPGKNKNDEKSNSEQDYKKQLTMRK
ncbi:MAG: cbb3-type cytochrome oxidase assembly protein CcoS [Bacteroidetes bacterium]|nr:cbb3-type cytochrome oxidase assembly protein CcoS [Bacteroidota bacterium]